MFVNMYAALSGAHLLFRTEDDPFLGGQTLQRLRGVDRRDLNRHVLVRIQSSAAAHTDPSRNSTPCLGYPPHTSCSAGEPSRRASLVTFQPI